MYTVGYLLSHMLTQTPSALEEASVGVVGSAAMLRQFTAVKGAGFKGLCAWNSNGRNPSAHSGTARCFHLARKTNNGVHIFQPSLVM